MIKKYNKLIRDRILEIIAEAGEKPYHRTLLKSEFQKEIKKKVLEEANELLKAKTKDDVVNEIVDMQELIDVLAAELRVKKLDIRRAQSKKNQARGGFKKRLFLIKTTK
jgi:predicted house-cleaning noncanonical NTP pyrophosphatase (MazG superfamily)